MAVPKGHAKAPTGNNPATRVGMKMPKGMGKGMHGGKTGVAAKPSQTGTLGPRRSSGKRK